MLPTWFLSRMIDYTFSIISGAGGFAISPQLTVIRMVERHHSPDFDEVYRLVDCTPRERVVQLLENLIESLRGLFCAGDASPFDVDRHGRTVFHVSYIWRLHGPGLPVLTQSG